MARRRSDPALRLLRRVDEVFSHRTPEFLGVDQRSVERWRAGSTIDARVRAHLRTLGMILDAGGFDPWHLADGSLVWIDESGERHWLATRPAEASA